MNLDLGFPKQREGTPTLQLHPHHLVTATLAVCPPRSLELKFESKAWHTSVAPRTAATASDTRLHGVSLGRSSSGRGLTLDVAVPRRERQSPLSPGSSRRGGGGQGGRGAGLGVPGLDVMLKFCVALTAFTF